MAWLFSLLVGLATAAATFPSQVTLVAEDGTRLDASFGAPSKADKGVVFIHMAGRTKDDWGPVAEKFYRQGVMVITVDLRGHGSNVTGPPPTLSPADYGAMAQDVRAAVGHLRKAGATKVALVGAELGANLALNVAADDPQIASVVAMSPGMDYHGVIAPDAVRRLGARAILFVASEDDAYGARSAGALDTLATGPHSLTLFEAAGKGTRMFNREPGLESTLVGFVSANWTVVAAVAPPAKKATIDTRSESTSLKTSGPLETPTQQPKPPTP